MSLGRCFSHSVCKLDCSRSDGFEPGLDARNAFLERFQVGGLARSGMGIPGSRAPTAVFLDVGEEGGEAVELPGGEGVELVVVALAAAHVVPEPDGGDVADAVGRVFGHVLLGLGAALLGRHGEPVVARGDLLLGGRVGQEVAGQLLDGEAVEGPVRR